MIAGVPGSVLEDVADAPELGTSDIDPAVETLEGLAHALGHGDRGSPDQPTQIPTVVE